MATTRQMELLIGKALFEPEFRKKLLKNPKKTAESMNIRLNPMQIERIKGLKTEDVDQVANDFDTLRLPNTAWGW